MPKRNVGSKGQLVIPKQMRDALGLKPGAEVSLEMRDQEIVIKKPKVKGSYTEYFITTASPKLKKKIDMKELINEEVEERNAIH
ncbi:MAG TPA: AbrB/MazE/SpoVT family DNA-binding domain-containing protein [Candidatus Limnocylindrales bacterium]|nr:AbrB/MazE/SpoVT family DNA-binding domain-containing protein [Candidatus Limnocylindrales bacterium]